MAGGRLKSERGMAKWAGGVMMVEELMMVVMKVLRIIDVFDSEGCMVLT